ncbi:MAG: GNAT family N-acetyltransferase [Pirellulales bacterium]
MWRRNSATLGFLPDGAFQDRAVAKHILVAIGEDGACVGYLLYRVSKRRASIVHLCVDSEARGAGHAAALVRHLIGITKHLRAVDLRCRRDFLANGLWPKLGFCAGAEMAGRSADGSELTCWRLDHGHADLFSDRARTLLDAALDSSVFLDIVDPAEVRNEESHGLLADWLQSAVRLHVTEELFNDIDRHKDSAVRRKRKSDAQLFNVIRSTADAYNAAEAKLRPLFGTDLSEQDESDLRHLIRTHAADIGVFVTRDEKLLGRSDNIYAACGLSVLRPAELIGRIDELLHERDYQRSQVAGTNKIVRQRVSAADDALLTCIQATDVGEKKSALREVLQPYFAQPQRFSCWVVRVAEDVGAFYVTELLPTHVLHVPVFRICSDRHTGSLIRTILSGLSYEIATHGGGCVTVSEPIASDAMQSAYDDLAFIATSRGRTRFVVPGIRSAAELSAELGSIVRTTEVGGPAVEQLIQLVESQTNGADALASSTIEHVVWPAKVRDGGIPSFVVPIRPDYAQHLFDENLARQRLFGAEVELALNPESVYYRAAKPGVLSSPGRILWYVSGRGKFDGTMRIRACSRILEVAVGLPKDLFKRFRRLGVYEWSDVFDTAKQDLNKPIMAIRFHDTELFPSPMEWQDFQAILKRHDVKTTLQSPTAIPSEAFDEIYEACRRTEPAAVALHSS